MGLLMKVECNECNAVAKITHRKNITDTLAHLYCDCSNPICNHRFVMNLSFERTLLPPASQTTGWLRAVINNLSEQERIDLLNS